MTASSGVVPSVSVRRGLCQRERWRVWLLYSPSHLAGEGGRRFAGRVRGRWASSEGGAALMRGGFTPHPAAFGSHPLPQGERARKDALAGFAQGHRLSPTRLHTHARKITTPTI